jgi:hypothetical protein
VGGENTWVRKKVCGWQKAAGGRRREDETFSPAAANISCVLQRAPLSAHQLLITDY